MSVIRALLMVVFGYVVVATLPPDSQAAGALRWSATASALILLMPPIALATRSLRDFLRADCILAMAPIYWLLLDPIQGRYSLYEVSATDVEAAFMSIFLFVAAVWLGSGLAVGSPPAFLSRLAAVKLNAKLTFRIGVLAFGLALLRFAIPANFDPEVMLQGLLSERWGAAWTRGSLGGTDAFLDHLSYFGFLLPVLTVITARYDGWRSLRTIALLVMAIVIGAFLAQSGNRRVIGVMLGSSGLLWFLCQDRVRIRTVVIGLSLVIGTMSLLESMLDYRNVGLAGVFDTGTSVQVQRRDVAVRVDDNFLRLAQMTSIFPEKHPYTGWDLIVWVAVRPVPRLFWPEKPLNPGFDLATYLGVDQYVTLSSSAVGELTMAGGTLGVVLGGLFYGYLAGWLNALREREPEPGGLLIYSLGVLALFVGVRSVIEVALMSYGILAWVALVLLLGLRERRKAATAILSG